MLKFSALQAAAFKPCTLADCRFSHTSFSVLQIRGMETNCRKLVSACVQLGKTPSPACVTPTGARATPRLREGTGPSARQRQVPLSGGAGQGGKESRTRLLGVGARNGGSGSVQESEPLAASRSPGPPTPSIGSCWQPERRCESTPPGAELPMGPGNGSAFCPFL